MITLSIVSLSGGTGRTTLTANLAATLASSVRKVVALDLDPQNALMTHFEMSPGQESGIINRRGRYHMSMPNGQVEFIPFGPLRDLAAAETAARSDPSWLRNHMSAISSGAADYLLIDTPATPCVWLDQALASSDHVLVVLRPDAGCYATLPALHEYLGSDRSVSYVLNQMDEDSLLCRDVEQAFHHALGRLLVPVTVPLDASVREAHARQHTITRNNRASVASACIRDLADWLVGHLPKQ